jgi:hypothetical protein
MSAWLKQSVVGQMTTNALFLSKEFQFRYLTRWLSNDTGKDHLHILRTTHPDSHVNVDIRCLALLFNGPMDYQSSSTVWVEKPRTTSDWKESHCLLSPNAPESQILSTSNHSFCFQYRVWTLILKLVRQVVCTTWAMAPVLLLWRFFFFFFIKKIFLQIWSLANFVRLFLHHQPLTSGFQELGLYACTTVPGFPPTFLLHPLEQAASFMECKSQFYKTFGNQSPSPDPQELYIRAASFVFFPFFSVHNIIRHCGTCYSGGRGRWTTSWRTAQAKLSRPYFKNKIKRKGLGLWLKR